MPPVVDQVQGGRGVAEGGEYSPQTVARHRWRQAIEQQIMLNQMEQQNKSVLSKWEWQPILERQVCPQ